MFLYLSILLFTVLCYLLYLYIYFSFIEPFFNVFYSINIATLVFFSYVYNFFILKSLRKKEKIFFFLSIVYSILSTTLSIIFAFYESCAPVILMFQMLIVVLSLSLYNYWFVNKIK